MSFRSERVCEWKRIFFILTIETLNATVQAARVTKTSSHIQYGDNSSSRFILLYAMLSNSVSAVHLAVDSL